ncbi:MAG: DUF805 domain-containing protein [Pseudomonadota bacterium]
MGFMEAVKSVFARYVDFQGRSPRSEYWWFVLFYILVAIVLSLLSAVVPLLGILLLVFYLAIIIPSISVAIRRLHDLDKSGWWLLLSFVPIANLLLLYWACCKGTDGDNQFGPDPLGNVAERFS